MLKSCLTVAWRNLLRHRAYSLINILGLAIGMACCIPILLFVQSELSYDRFHANAERTYRVIREIRASSGARSYSPTTPGPLAAGLREEFPEVQQAVRLWSWRVWIQYQGEWFGEGAKLVDADMLAVLTFPLVRGDRETALREPFSVVISDEMAEKYFGDEDPMGKVVTIDRESLSGDYTVTGVWDSSVRSAIRFDCLISTVPEAIRSYWDEWQRRPFFETYVVLPQDYPPEELESKLSDFVARHMGANESASTTTTYRLQPLTRIHLHSNADYNRMEPWRGDNITYVYLISLVGFFILAIACVNFVNLATAGSTHRAREVGLRKVVGAHPRQLVGQFLGESVIVAILALVAASGLAWVLLPAFNAFTGQTLSLDVETRIPMLLQGLGLAVSVGLLSGVYPAFLLSSFTPVAALKGTLKGGSGKTASFRKGLVLFQFAVTILLIIGTGIVYRQLEYIGEKKLGFDQANLVSLPIFRANVTRQIAPEERLSWRYDEVKQAFLKHPHVLKATASRHRMGSGHGGGLHTVRPEGADGKDWRMRVQEADADFLETYQIELVAGRNFSGEIASDAEEAFLLNETAVRQLGWTDPIGKRFEVESLKRKGTVIGVIGDFHGASLRENIEPLALCMNPSGYLHLTLRIDPRNLPATLDLLRAQWLQFVPSRPFRYHFMDEWLERMYRDDVKMAQISAGASLLAVFVACLGLFGMMLFTVERHTKAIGIRKVLGATVPSIFLMLSREFTQLALIANVVAWPIAYFVATRWLRDFAYRVDPEVWIFFLGAALTLSIAWATVSYQVMRAATSNPVDALRCE